MAGSAEHARLVRPREQSISAPDEKPRSRSLSRPCAGRPTISTLCLSLFSRNKNNSSSDESNKLLTDKPTSTFASVTLRRLGCGPSVAAVALSKELETDKVKKKKTNQKKNKKKIITKSKRQKPVVPDVCCAPGFGIASDVVATAKIEVERTNHRERVSGVRRPANVQQVSASDSQSAFGTACARSDASSERDLRRLSRHAPAGLPEIALFQRELLRAWSVNGYDQYRDWRLDVDTMSYEELLDLSDRIGYVGTGLGEDEIFHCLRKTKQTTLESLPLLISADREWKCSICQEGCKADEEVGRLNCGHDHHLPCIKQWLMKKNSCPICKIAALANAK